MEKMKNELLRILKNQNKLGKVYDVELVQKKSYTWSYFFKMMGRLNVGFLIIAFIGALAFNNDGDLPLPTILIYSLIWTIANIYFISKRFRNRLTRFLKPKPIDRELRALIVNNGLYKANGADIYDHIDLSYMETPNEVWVWAYKIGDNWQDSADKLGEKIESVMGMKMLGTEETINYYKYELAKRPIERTVIENEFDLLSTDYSLKIPIYGSLNMDLKASYSSIVSGASGGGKSFYTFSLLTKFIAQTIKFEENGQEFKKHAQLWAIDPKMSDLYKLFKVSGMPEELYGHTNAEAFKIVKNYLELMERRKEIYASSDKFNVVGLDIGMEPTLLVIEEYSSLVASMDSKQKKEFENMIVQIAQKGRQLSMGIMIVMQQPRAESLSTAIREQCNYKFFMGNPSSESASMMFGASKVPKVSGKGVGLYSVEQSEPKEFEAPMFQNDVFATILPIWKDRATFYKEELEQW